MKPTMVTCLKLIAIFLSLVYQKFAECHPRQLNDSGQSSRPRRSSGGFPASIEDYPFVASIRLAGGHICGGSILTRDIILTASHCILPKYPVSLMSVKVGDSDINYKGSWHPVAKTVQYTVINYEIGPLAMKTTSRNDVALIKLKTPIELNNKTTRPVKLFNADDDVFDYDMGIVVGWGIFRSTEVDHSEPAKNGSRSRNRKILRNPSSFREVELDIAPKDKCDDFFTEGSLNKEFCTYTLGKVSCSGDSGSPFMVNGRQAGIVSWSPRHHDFYCDGNTNIGFFADVSKYREWIDQQVKILSES